MTVGESLRALAFFVYDHARGGCITRHISDLERLIAHPEERRQVSSARLATLLAHASQTTPFYRRFRGAADLRDFPVVEKRTVREHYDEFFSDAFQRSGLTAFTTSGSYGTPFTFYFNRDKKARRNAEVIVFGRWAGYRVGMRHAYVRVTRKNGLLTFLQNEVMMNPSVLNDRWFEAQRRRLLRGDFRALIGFPSAVEALASYCARSGDRPEQYPIRTVITMAEALSDSAREKISGAWRCDVLSRYAAVEFGVLAQECREGRQHHLNEASYVIDILQLDSDRPAEPGELGRVVVTDLFSHAMPLIRYDTGDLAVRAESCRCGSNLPALARIEGRRTESVYNTRGERLSPIAVNDLMRDIDHVFQFQFTQHTARTYSMKLCVMPQFSSEGLIRERLAALLGPDAEVRIEYVDSIPMLRSGKRPYILSEYQPA